MNLTYCTWTGRTCAFLRDAEFQDWLSRIPDARVTTCNENARDWDALIALFNHTNGLNWSIRHSWLTDRPLNNWYGVEADADGRVRKIDLDENNLEGEIPPAIGQLEGLEELRLGINKLSGPLPPELGQLDKLHTLRLTSNNLSGPIPPEMGQMAGT